MSVYKDMGLDIIRLVRAQGGTINELVLIEFVVCRRTLSHCTRMGEWVATYNIKKVEA